jgi:hypothetical protein
VRRGIVWAIPLPLVGAGMLAAHELGYRLVGVPRGDEHGYLAHAPQGLAVLVTLSLLAIAAHGRATPPAPWQFAALALGAFVAQEHAERLLHAGELPFLLVRPEFLAGLACQLPVAFLVHRLARFLLAVAPVRRTAPPRLTLLPVAVVTAPAAPVRSAPAVRPTGRAPPCVS